MIQLKNNIYSPIFSDPFFKGLFQTEIKILDQVTSADFFDINELFIDSSSPLPKINIYLLDNKMYVIEALIGGIDKNDINIDITKNYVILSYTKKKENEKDKKNYIVKQISDNSFSKKIKIPENVIAPEEARYDNGKIILEFKIKEESQPKKIKII